MDLIAPVTRHLIGPAWAARERSAYLRHLRVLRRTQYDPQELIEFRQWQAVTQLVEYAYHRTPFWRDRLDAIGMKPADIRTPEDVRRVPVLTKEDLRMYGERLFATGFSKEKLYKKRTSGSTGVSVEVWVDDADLQHQRACTVRSDEWTGWRLGDRVAMLWGNPDYLKHGWRGYLRNRLLDRAEYLDTLKMDEAAMGTFHKKLRQRPPALLMGHAHSLYLFANFVRREGGAGFHAKGILSAAMVLHDWERKVIEEVFGCPVTNRYGAEEVSLIACECEAHQGLHINADGAFIETIRPDGTAAGFNEPGAVIVTALKSQAMPIIRYQIGDMAVLSDRRCVCGRGLPVIERIEGRVADYVVTKSGQLISGISLTENFALEIPGVAQMQIIQKTIESFLFRMVKGHDFGPESLRRLAILVRERFGEGTIYECEFADRILPEPSGKYRFCISKVRNHFNALA